jgi:hypothetical protein
LGNSLVLLKFAVQQGGSKAVEISLSCNLSRSLQAEVVAGQASGAFPVSYLPQEVFEEVFIPVNHADTVRRSPLPNSRQPSLILLVGMNIGIKEKADQFMLFLLQHLAGIHKTGGATDMNQDFH